MNLIMKTFIIQYCLFVVLGRNFTGLKPIDTKCTHKKEQQNYLAIINLYLWGLTSHCKQMEKRKLKQCGVNWQGFFRMNKCSFTQIQTVLDTAEADPCLGSTGSKGNCAVCGCLVALPQRRNRGVRVKSLRILELQQELALPSVERHKETLI